MPINYEQTKNTNTKFGGDDGIVVPVGNTAARPGAPELGTLRYNNQLNLPEFYTSSGWSAVAPPPTITTVSGTINENTSSTLTVNGTNFVSGTTVTIEGSGVGGVARTLTTTFVNSGQLTADTNATSVNYTGGASYDVKVTNPSGLTATLTSAGTIDRDPIWSTSSGTVATINDEGGSYSPIATLSASDPDGSAIAYSVVSGSLPGNVSLNSSNGQLTGNPDNISSSTTYTFTVRATSNSQTADRSFNIIVNPLADGSTSARAATSPAALRSLGITSNGGYWIRPPGQTAFLTFIRFNYLDGSDWMCLLKVHNTGDMPSGSAFWTNGTLNNENDMNLTSGSWSKYGIWNTYTFTRIAMEMGAGRVFPIMIYNTGRTMFNFINGNSPGAGFAGFAADSTDPSMGSNVAYNNFPMKAGSNIGFQSGTETLRQMWGINSWGNNAANGNPDCRGLASVGRAGAWVGCPIDEGGHAFNNATNSGADSGLGIGGGAGNSARTWSSGYGDWSSGCSVVDLLPGYLWVR